MGSLNSKACGFLLCYDLWGYRETLLKQKLQNANVRCFYRLHFINEVTICKRLHTFTPEKVAPEMLKQVTWSGGMALYRLDSDKQPPVAVGGSREGWAGISFALAGERVFLLSSQLLGNAWARELVWMAVNSSARVEEGVQTCILQGGM